MDKQKIYDFSSPDFYVQYKNKLDDRMTMKHTHYHDYFEIYYFLGYEMTHMIDNVNYTFQKHDIAFIRPYTFHRTNYSNCKHGERIMINFRPNIYEHMKNDFK